MSVKPVDMQMTMPKTQQMSKLQQIENNKSKDFVHKQDMLQNSKIERDLTRPNETFKGDKVKIHKDGSHKNKNQHRNSEDEEKEENKNKVEAKISGLGNKIDIKI